MTVDPEKFRSIDNRYWIYNIMDEIPKTFIEFDTEKLDAETITNQISKRLYMEL